MTHNSNLKGAEPCFLSSYREVSPSRIAPAYWFLNGLYIVLATTDSTGGAFSMVHGTAAPGHETPYDLHHDEDEAFYVLEGEFTFLCDGAKTVVRPGGISFCRAGFRMGFDAAGRGCPAS